MRKWIPVLLIAVATIASVAIYSKLPERIPTHWNMSGEIDGWSSRFWGAWMMPLMMAVIWPVMRLIPHIDPHRANYAKFRGMYEALIIATMAFMLAMHLLLLAAATGSHIPISRIVIGAVGAFFVVIGVLLPHAHPNWFVGIRTPWTLSSDLAWERTHKVGGLLFIATGTLTMLTTLLAPKQAMWVLLVSGTAMMVFLFVYSYVVWKKDGERHSAA
ncbi:MAG: DUF1648 domain-containing protein [Gemmatimonadaceae bacterium]|nr:DUF1648 domain-containing protein [Gemmatimonadaceae bacterium]